MIVRYVILHTISNIGSKNKDFDRLESSDNAFHMLRTSMAKIEDGPELPPNFSLVNLAERLPTDYAVNVCQAGYRARTVPITTLMTLRKIGPVPPTKDSYSGS